MLKELPKNLDLKSKKCIFLVYDKSGKMGYRLLDPEGKKIIHNHDVVFNEKKLHKTPIKHVEMRRVTFQDDNPLAHDGRRQVVHASNVDQMVQPDTPSGSQQRADDSSSVGGYDEPHMVYMHDGQQVDMPLRRLTRMSRPLDRFVPSTNYVMLTDCGEPSCYKEGKLCDDKHKWKLAM